MTSIFIIIGWIGIFLMILDYFLLSKRMVSPNKIKYHLINGVAGVGVLASSLYVKLWPVVILNIFWITVAFYSIIKINLNKK